MEITGFGLLVLPIVVLLIPFDPRRLLIWTIVLAPFEAASVLNVSLGGYEIGIQPGYFAALAFLTAVILRRAATRPETAPVAEEPASPSGSPHAPRTTHSLVWAFRPLFLFAALAVVGALALPALFGGRVLVFPPRAGVALGSLAPLEASGTNVTQSLYLLFLCAFALAVSHTVTRPAPISPRAPRTAHPLSAPIVAYVVTGLLVVALGVYQLVAHYGGLAYPESFLYSNPVYYQGFEQAFGVVKRMSSTFTEPSAAAYYLAGLFGYALARYLQSDRPLPPAALTLAGLAGLMLSTSATAYATALVVLLLAAVAVPSRHRATRLATLAAMAVIALVALGWWLVRQAPAQVTADLELINVAARIGTISFVDRIGADLHSLGLVPATFGLGVGWGSNRASSLATTLVSTVGIAGVALLGWFAWRVVRLVRERLAEVKRQAGSANRADDTDLEHVAPLALSVVAMLVAGAIAVPDINHIALWVNLAMLIGLAVGRAQ